MAGMAGAHCTRTLFPFRNLTKLEKGDLYDNACNLVLNVPDLEHIQAAARVAKQFDSYYTSRKQTASWWHKLPSCCYERALGQSRGCRRGKREQKRGSKGVAETAQRSCCCERAQ